MAATIKRVTEQPDSQLLRAYAEAGSEAAFAELARRHVDLVFSAALRMVCDSHLAQDVTQGVFVALAQNAAQLTDRRVLSGWLHRTAQNIAAQTVRTEVRRRLREREASAMNELLSSAPDAPWELIAPHLDAALGQLSEPERDALLLRYFERKSAREIAQVLGVSDEAAQKRVTRAIGHLRDCLAKRGVAVGASALILGLSTYAVQAAPVGLITAATLNTASFPNVSITTKGLLLMAISKKFAYVATAVLLLVGGGTTALILHSSHHPDQPTVSPVNRTSLPAVATNVLVFRSVRSWNRDVDFEDVLAELKIPYDVRTAAEMADTDLSPYGFVVIPGAQWQDGFYHQYALNRARFDHYVTNGGTLVLELNGAERDGITLPGGVSMVGHGAVDNAITAPAHPILIPMGGKRIHANYASHGYLTGVPKEASVLVTEMAGQQPLLDKPTFVEYSFGAGRVIAACQCFHDRDGSGRGPMMETLLVYASEKKWFTLKN